MTSESSVVTPATMAEFSRLRANGWFMKIST